MAVCPLYKLRPDPLGNACSTRARSLLARRRKEREEDVATTQNQPTTKTSQAGCGGVCGHLVAFVYSNAVGEGNVTSAVPVWSAHELPRALWRRQNCNESAKMDLRPAPATLHRQCRRALRDRLGNPPSHRTLDCGRPPRYHPSASSRDPVCRRCGHGPSPDVESGQEGGIRMSARMLVAVVLTVISLCVSAEVRPV